MSAANSQAVEPAPRRPSLLRRWGPIAVLATGAALGWALFGDQLTFETLRDNREALLAWRDSNFALAAVVYFLVYVVVIAFSLPGGLAMTLTGGFLFGLVAGSLLTLFAATFGATAIFLAAKTSLGEHLQARLAGQGGMTARFQRGLRENELSYLFLMRLVPAVPFFVANLAPAFLGVGLRNYLLTTFFGIMPATVIYTWVGSGLGEVFARGETPDLGVLFEPRILGPLLGLCALAALPIVVRALRRKGGA